jgi:hypothetical protein
MGRLVPSAAHVKKGLRSFFAPAELAETAQRMLALAEATLRDGSGA